VYTQQCIIKSKTLLTVEENFLGTGSRGPGVAGTRVDGGVLWGVALVQSLGAHLQHVDRVQAQVEAPEAITAPGAATKKNKADCYRILIPQSI
jgi:hypothetical protein